MPYLISFECPTCGSEIKAKWNFGDYLKCLNCKGIFGTDYDDYTDVSIWIDTKAEPFNPKTDTLAEAAL